MSDPYGGSDLEYPNLGIMLLLLLLLGPLGLTSNTVHLFTSDASQTHKTIYIPKAHDTYYPPVTQFVTDSDGNSDSDSDSDSDSLSGLLSSSSACKRTPPADSRRRKIIEYLLKRNVINWYF